MNWEVRAVRRQIVVVCAEGVMRWVSRRRDIHKLALYARKGTEKNGILRAVG